MPPFQQGRTIDLKVHTNFESRFNSRYQSIDLNQIKVELADKPEPISLDCAIYMAVTITE